MSCNEIVEPILSDSLTLHVRSSHITRYRPYTWHQRYQTRHI